MGDLLSDFDGVSSDFSTWERQLRFVKMTYRLEDDCAKILMGMKLKKKAFEWFHSRPEHISMSFETILEKLRAMFERYESKLTIRKKFEDRAWRKEESFHEYLHDKTIMGNRVPVDKDELLEHIIDGIPDDTLRDQARMQEFPSADALLRAFSRITLRNRNVTGLDRRDGRGVGPGERRERIVGSGEWSGGGSGDGRRGTPGAERCFNCGARDHVSANCPTKSLGLKCFECGKNGHIALKCPKKNGEPKKTVVAAVSQIERKKYTKDVIMGDRVITALIDTGSDISIMRASKHAKVGSPKLRASEMEFCGVGGYRASAFGEFQMKIMIDDFSYSILIRVVPDTVLQYGLLIGADFLDTVEVNLRRDLISITPICDQAADDETRPEVFAIDLRDASEADVSNVQSAEHRHIITNLVENYRPNRIQEVDVKMTIIVKDDEPIYQKARRLSQSERDIVNAQVDEWEKQGIVRPSISDFASPIVLVKKKDESHRLCVDYRMLNTKIIKDRYPLLVIYPLKVI
ncbi:uncharacterized protein [Linepithema humile]|uniref:uncharacterized protein n=1 Tax=Linepithema humile TaxID=83485 RepID=UPI00351E7FB9